jgi:hypothetical protein
VQTKETGGPNLNTEETELVAHYQQAKEYLPDHLCDRLFQVQYVVDVSYANWKQQRGKLPVASRSRTAELVSSLQFRSSLFWPVSDEVVSNSS